MDIENIADVGRVAGAAESLMQKAIEYAPKVLLALVVLWIGFRLVGWLGKILDKVFALRHIDDSLAGFLKSIITSVAKIMVILSVAGMIGIQTTSFIALLGAAGLAVGLALQGSLANFAGGVMILLFKPFKIGDYVAVTGGEGIVKNIDIFNTILNTLDNKTIIVPNAEVSNNAITNFTEQDTRRVDISIGADYSDSVSRVKEVLLSIAKNDSRVLDDPATAVVLTDFGDSSVNFQLRAWVKTGDYWDAMFTMNEEIKKQFDANDISIPYPQQDVYVHQVQK